MIKLGWIYVYRFCVVGNTYAISGSVDHAEHSALKLGKICVYSHHARAELSSLNFTALLLGLI